MDPSGSDLEGSDEIRREYESVRFSDQPVKKFLMRVYLNYTIQQESLSKNFQVLRKKVASEFGPQIPAWFSDSYRALNLPLMKYYAILTTNTRIIVMSVCVLLDVPWLYFTIEVVGINALMLLVIARQEKLCAGLAGAIDQRRAAG